MWYAPLPRSVLSAQGTQEFHNAAPEWFGRVPHGEWREGVLEIGEASVSCARAETTENESDGDQEVHEEERGGADGGRGLLGDGYTAGQETRRGVDVRGVLLTRWCSGIFFQFYAQLTSKNWIFVDIMTTGENIKLLREQRCAWLEDNVRTARAQPWSYSTDHWYCFYRANVLFLCLFRSFFSWSSPCSWSWSIHTLLLQSASGVFTVPTTAHSVTSRECSYAWLAAIMSTAHERQAPCPVPTSVFFVGMPIS